MTYHRTTRLVASSICACIYQHDKSLHTCISILYTFSFYALVSGACKYLCNWVCLFVMLYADCEGQFTCACACHKYMHENTWAYTSTTMYTYPSKVSISAPKLRKASLLTEEQHIQTCLCCAQKLDRKHLTEDQSIHSFALFPSRWSRGITKKQWCWFISSEIQYIANILHLYINKQAAGSVSCQHWYDSVIMRQIRQIHTKPTIKKISKQQVYIYICICICI